MGWIRETRICSYTLTITAYCRRVAFVGVLSRRIASCCADKNIRIVMSTNYAPVEIVPMYSMVLRLTSEINVCAYSYEERM